MEDIQALHAMAEKNSSNGAINTHIRGYMSFVKEYNAMEDNELLETYFLKSRNLLSNVKQGVESRFLDFRK